MIDLRLLDKHRDYVSEAKWGRLSEAQREFAGCFRIPVKGVRKGIFVIASSGKSPDEPTGWDHISVSTPIRCPTWDEMCILKDMFLGPDVWAMQLHPPETDNISNHRYCLHIWRPLDVEIPQPPAIMVGQSELGTINHRRIR